MNHDFIRLANDMRRAHLLGLGFRIPAMTCLLYTSDAADEA